MNKYDEIERAGFTATIYYDEEPTSPDDWDTFGSIAYSASRIAWNADDVPGTNYDYGRFHVWCDDCDGRGWDSDESDGPDVDCTTCEGTGQVINALARCKAMHGDVVAVLPLYACDGPYTTLEIADSWQDADGWVFATRESATMTGVPVESYSLALEQELTAWNQYLSGDVYGVIIRDPSGNEIDSCWGFYGDDYARESAAEMLDIEAVRLIEKHPGMRDLKVC